MFVQLTSVLQIGSFGDGTTPPGDFELIDDNGLDSELISDTEFMLIEG